MKNKIFKILIIVILAIYPLSNTLHILAAESFNSSVTAQQANDLSSLLTIEEKNAAEIEKEIEVINEKKQEELKEYELRLERENNINILFSQLESGETSFRQIMKGTVIAGDSLMHGLNEYKVLDQAYLVTKVSASLNHLEDNLSTIINMNPKVLITHYGLNNMSTNDAVIDNFVSTYERLLNELRESLPDTRIVVSSVFNVSDHRSKGPYSDIPHFNEKLKAMCEKNGYEFLDNSDILYGESDYYEHDGMHVKRKFYVEKFLPNLIIELEL